MRKVFQIVFLLLAIIAFGGFIYYVGNLDAPHAGGMIAYTGFLAVISCIMGILIEDRPKHTEAQRRHSEKIENQAFWSLILTAVAAMIIIFLNV